MNDVIAQRAGRIAFGIVMFTGAVVLAVFAAVTDGWHAPLGLHAWQLIVGSWLAATIAAVVVWAVVVVSPRPRNSDALRRAALTVPSVGIALLLPLTLHLPFWAAADATAFDEWCALSVRIVGHTHIIFAFLVWLRARALTGLARPVTVKRIYILTCAFAAIPFVIPVVFVAITGVPIAVLLARMEKIAKADREASHDVPFAIARTA